MKSLRHAVPNKVLCALVVAEDCPGYVPIEDLYVDGKGHRWDICKPCADWEADVSGDLTR